MDNANEVPQPRVIAQVGDDGANGSLRLIWVPPRPMTEAERHSSCRPEGAVTEGRFDVETVERNALDEPGWRPGRSLYEGETLYPIVLKLHTAYEQAWAERESIAAHAHDLFEVLRKDEARFAELVRKVEMLTDRVAAGTRSATERVGKAPGTERAGWYAGIFTGDFGSAPGGGIYSKTDYDAANGASCETVTYRARRLTDRFFEDRHAATRQMNADVGRSLLFEIAYAELEDCEQMERLRQKAPRDTTVGYTDPDRPHIVNGEFQSDKYPTTPRGKVPLSVKDADAQDLLWVYAQRRRAVDVGLKPPSELSPPVARLIAAARVFIRTPVTDDVMQAKELEDAVKAYEAQT